MRRSDQQLVLQTMKWGLVPHWSKFEDSSLNTTNARAENLAEGGGMWASLRGSKRCVIPVQGYYEWLAKDKQKFPYFTKRKDGNVMLLAGLYDGATIEGEQNKRRFESLLHLTQRKIVHCGHSVLSQPLPTTTFPGYTTANPSFSLPRLLSFRGSTHRPDPGLNSLPNSFSHTATKPSSSNVIRSYNKLGKWERRVKS